MASRFAPLDRLPRPRDAITAWVETDPEAVHFLDAVFSAGPGLANVRREYRDEGTRQWFKVFIAPQSVDEALRTLRSAARYVRIGEVQIEP
ncbi:MAG: hypothetical protein BIP78_0529 [Candidatus Bipolaricaulis sibiricus]|uniref:DUF493 domain-containing protein n=1 Tax=Bipolaricaulis sibiricus TaxID=2501609 RepID=A0A410FT87_BIPS1|nr:MAG: hypothetical protein BIP78_0529 [Candidatus Bipolaricaulis sibiricus]